MAGIGNTPGGGNGPKLPFGGGGSARNPLEKKELDILDPEAQAKSKGKTSLADKIGRAAKKVKRLINLIKSIPPQVWLIIGIVVLVIFIVGGFIGFFTLMPGLVINKLKEFGQGALDTVQSWFTTDADAYINDDDIVNLANYLEEMEYDLVGYGFITPNPNFSEDAGFINYTELLDQGYIYFEKRGDDENSRYYNEAGEAFDGCYYNSLGLLVDNSTGEIVTGEYVDEYGIQRSTEEVSTNGAGKIIGFGNDFLANVFNWTVDTKLLRTYLLSDYRIYSIRNDDEGLLANIFGGIKQTFGGYDGAWSKGLLKFFYVKNGMADTEWSSSLGHWIVYGDDISISRTSTGGQMSVKNGHFNNPTVFTIDGWSDRYGMNLEFLLSLHLATMQPDLVYAMLQSFDTEVQVYLEDSGEATVDAAYVDMMEEGKNVENEDDRIMLNDVEQTLSDGGFDVASWAVNDMAATEWVNGLAITKKNAQYLLTHLPLKSPPNCTGQAQDQIVVLATDDTVFGWRWASTNSMNSYGLDSETEAKVYDIFNEYEEFYYTDASGNQYVMSADNCDASLGTSNEAYLDDNYSFFEDPDSGVNLSDYSYTGSDVETTEPEINEIETKVLDSVGYSGETYYSLYNTKEVKITRTYSAEVEGEEVEYEWTTIKYLIYKTGIELEIPLAGTDPSVTTENWDEEDYEWVDTIVFEFIIRDKTTQELVDSGLMNYDEETGEYTPVNPAETRCSDDPDLVKCCKNCKNYVKNVIQALGAVSDQDYATYTPYIARVLGSWFRDTYFIVPEYADNAILNYIDEAPRTSAEQSMISNSYGENANFVNVDEEYLADTEEYWTAYEMKLDDSGNETDEYQLYYLYPNGITSDYKLEDFLEDPYTAVESYSSGFADRYNLTSGSSYDSQEEAEEAGHAFVKKAKTTVVTELSSSELEDVIWSAYEFNSDGAATGWIRIEYEDENDEVNDVYDTIGEEALNPEGGFFYNLTSTNEVTQVEDAQRSETNPTVKWLFKYRKFYVYDGNKETADKIAADKEAVLEWTEDYLKNTLGYSASTVAHKLGAYGRSALRQTYDNSTISFDWEDVSEEWLDWQLDMYYSGIIECPEDDYKLGNLAFIVTKDEDGNITSIEETTDLDYDAQENEELRIGDPRDPNLTNTTNITKSSLEAFTILENTKTLASEYSYRDFKELIVELNYFDKEDLSDAVEEVFTWVLPDIDPTGWPIRPWDKQDTEYGALIESHGTYEALGVIFEGSENGEGTENVDESTIQFVGDSWIAGLQNIGVAESTYFYGVGSKHAESPEMSIDSIQVNSNASAIVLYLGVNNTNSANAMNNLIDELIERYSLPVYVIKVNHVGAGYSYGSLTASTMNSNIDSYNRQVQSHCNSTDGAYFIDTSNGLEDSNGYLSSEYTSDNLHLGSQSAYQKWYDNIISAIGTAGGGSSEEPSEPDDSNSNDDNNSSNNNTGISLESADQNTSEGHYSYIVSAYGTTYKVFSQGGYYGGGGAGTIFPYKDGSTKIGNDHSADTPLGTMGCGIYSISSLLSAYSSEEVTPLTTVEYIHENYGETAFNNESRMSTMDKFLNDNGVTGEWYYDDIENKITEAFDAGKPIIVALSPTNTAPWTTQSGHFICMVGVDGSTVYTADSVDSMDRLKAEGGIDAIMACINSATTGVVWIPDEAPAGNGSGASLFQGYEGGEYVSSPVTGKVIEYGTHERINVYTDKTEVVGYVVIEAINSECFTEDNVANNSGDTEDIDNAAAAEGLNLFYDEYEDTCAGFTITIDGFKVDLNTTDEEGNNGKYEQNEVVALYNSQEQEEREENEQKKEDAPFFINYGESADLGSLPETYDGGMTDSSNGYYIKEGKYLGITYTDEESAALTIETEEPDSTEPEEPTEPDDNQDNPDNPEESPDDSNSGNSANQEEHTGPANYIRIMVKDREYSIIDNVEDYFDIPEPTGESAGSGDAFTGEYSEEFLYWLLIDTEGPGGGDNHDLPAAITRGYSIAGDIGDGTITAAFGVTNWCNELFWNLGYGQYVNNIRGSNVGMNAGDHIPIEVCNDVAIAELDTNVAAVQALFPGQTFTETQMAALLSVNYNFGSIPDSLLSAIRSGDEGTIASTWTTLGSGQWGQYPGLKTRREAEYKMWSGTDYYHCYGGGKLVFSSETPFTDYLNGNFSVCTYQ